jgi:hypothetical protein
MDDTHLGSTSNPTGLKKASGDSSAGVDAATLKAVAESLVVNGMIDLSAIQMIERSTLSHLNDNKVTSLSGAQSREKRSEKINELTSGIKTPNFESTQINSLGDIMCELMVSMIQSTSERRQIERELRTILAVAQKEQSKQLAEEVMKKMEVEIEQKKKAMWGEFAISMASTAISVGGAAMQGAKMAGGKQKTFASVRMALNKEQQMKGIMQQMGQVAIAFSNLDDIKRSSALEESIQRKETALKLTRSVGRSVEDSLKSIDTARGAFMNTMKNISRALHDGYMQIIRNSVI